VENTHNIEIRHVQAAIRDSELTPMTQAWWKQKSAAIAAAITLAAAIVTVMAGWWYSSQSNKPNNAEIKPAALIQPNTTPVKTTSTDAISPALSTASAVEPISSPLAAAQISVTDQNTTSSAKAVVEDHTILFEQRLEATQTMLANIPAGSASIQLYYTNDVRPLRIEEFLKRADNLGKLQEIYVLPIKINGKKGLRVLYGIYPSSKEARSGIQHLPKRYLDAYAPAIYLLDDAPPT